MNYYNYSYAAHEYFNYSQHMNYFNYLYGAHELFQLFIRST